MIWCKTSSAGREVGSVWVGSSPAVQATGRDSPPIPSEEPSTDLEWTIVRQKLPTN